MSEPFYPQRAQALGVSAWSIDPANGSDSAQNVNGAVLASFGELSRRWGKDSILPATTTVTVQGDLAEVPEFDVGLADGAELRIVGVPTTLYSGSVTGVTAMNPAGNVPADFTDAAVGDWATAGPGGTTLIGERVRLTSGASVGGISWLAKRMVPTQARVSPWAIEAPFNTQMLVAAPAPADTFVVERLPRLLGFRGRTRTVSTGANFAALVLRDIDVRSDPFAGIVTTEGTNTSSGLVLMNCRLTASALNGPGFVYFSNCHLSTFFIHEIDVWTDASLLTSPFGILRLAQRASLTLYQHSLVQGTTLDNFQGGVFQPNGGGAAIFDAPGNALSGLAAGILANRSTDSSFWWGSGNTAYGIVVDGGQLVVYDSTKPIVTGAAGDARIGGVPMAWAAIPFFDVIKACGIIQV